MKAYNTENGRDVEVTHLQQLKRGWGLCIRTKHNELMTNRDQYRYQVASWRHFPKGENAKFVEQSAVVADREQTVKELNEALERAKHRLHKEEKKLGTLVRRYGRNLEDTTLKVKK